MSADALALLFAWLPLPKLVFVLFLYACARRASSKYLRRYLSRSLENVGPVFLCLGVWQAYSVATVISRDTQVHVLVEVAFWMWACSEFMLTGRKMEIEQEKSRATKSNERDTTKHRTGISFKGRRIGIVLSGGGLKGAYQIGVMRVLLEAGIKPVAVSGASAGALNAMLFAILVPSRAEEFWREHVIRRKPFRVHIPSLLARGAALASMWFPLLLHYSFSRIQRSAFPQHFLEEHVSPQGRTSLYQRTGLYAQSMSITAMVLLLWGIWQGLGPIVLPAESVRPVGYMLVALLLLSIIVGPRLWGVLEKGNVAALRNHISKLTRDALRESLGTARYDMIVTVAEQRNVFDYDDLGCYRPQGIFWGSWTFARAVARSAFVAVARPRFVPTYCHFDAPGIRQSLKTLVASAALPAGIFGYVLHDGRRLWDGGLADNCPVFPLLPLDLDAVIVVDIGTRKARLPEDIHGVGRLLRLAATDSAHLARIATRYLDRFKGQDFDDATEAMRGRLDRIFEWSGRMPEIHYLRPSFSPGLTDTLFASPDTLESWIDLGKRDGRKFLDNLTSVQE